jgi:hypothetical protein
MTRMRMILRMTRLVRMRMRPPQPVRAHEIHREPDRRYRNRFLVVNLHRHQQPLHRLEHHERRHREQKDRARITPEHFDLPRPECIRAAARLAARERVGKCGQAQCERVRAHVPAVGEHGHRVEPPAAGDLDDHHDGGQPERAPDAALCERIARVEARRVAVMLVCIQIEGLGQRLPETPAAITRSVLSPGSDAIAARGLEVRRPDSRTPHVHASVTIGLQCDPSIDPRRACRLHSGRG